MINIIDVYVNKIINQGKRIINKNPIFGSQSRLRDSKPRNIALHAFCGIETIELPLHSSHKKSLFEPRTAPSRKHYEKRL